MKLHHLGIAVKSIEESALRYEVNLGWKKITELIYDPIQKVKILFMIDDHGFRYELLEPTGNDSPINKFLERRIGLYHFSYEVKDIQTKIEELTKTGFFLITGPVKAIAFKDNLIAFLINVDNLIIELVEH